MNRSGPVQRRLPLLVTALAALVCTGCQLRLAVDVEVNRNGGGTLAVAVTADEELLALAADAGADPLAELADAGRALGDGWRRSASTAEDGSRTVTLAAPFADPAELAALTGDLADALEADEADLLDGMELSVTDDEVALSGVARAQPTPVVREYGVTPRRAVRLLRRNDAFDYTVAVTLPGEVLAADGAQRDDRTVTWTVPAGREVSFAARGTRPGPPWLRGLLGALAGGVVAGGLLWFVARRRRRRAP